MGDGRRMCHLGLCRGKWPPMGECMGGEEVGGM
jgi:hypothetical protein